MKALITGIAGFAGSHLTDYLQNRGDEVAGIEQCDAKDCEAFAKAHNVKVYQGDIRDENLIEKAIKQFGPEIVFHLAAQSSVKRSFEDPFDTFSANSIGTLVLLETISHSDTNIKVLVVSSSEVYGRLEPSECPVSEDHPFHPVNPYAVSKATVDLLAYQYYKAYNMPVYIARAFSHSGPGQKTVGVLSDWAFQVAKIELGRAQPVIKVGNMQVRRDYTDVRDVVRAYVDIAERGNPGDPYNVCAGVGYELKELLETYQKFSKMEIQVVVDQSRIRPVDIPILIGSNKKIKKDTGWKQSIPIETTLRDIYDYWREHFEQ